MPQRGAVLGVALRLVGRVQVGAKALAAVAANRGVRMRGRQRPDALDNLIAHEGRVGLVAADVPDHVREATEVDEK